MRSRADVSPLLGAAADALWAGNILLRCACAGIELDPDHDENED
jgi:hypothetical protein